MVVAQSDSSNLIITYMSAAPTFNNGTVANFLPWIYKYVEYPKSALKDSISGRVIARILIDSTGTVTKVNIIKGVRYDIDSSVTKVLRLSPKWIPAKQGLRNISVPILIPVDFDISDPAFMKKISEYKKGLKSKKSTNH